MMAQIKNRRNGISTGKRDYLLATNAKEDVIDHEYRAGVQSGQCFKGSIDFAICAGA